MSALVAAREGEPSHLSELFSQILQAPVRVVDPFLSFGFWKGRYVASLRLRPDNVRGPAGTVAQLFKDSQLVHAAATALAFVLKLHGVYSTAHLPPDAECGDEPIAIYALGTGDFHEYSKQELRLTAALYAKRAAVVEHVRATGRLPEEMNRGGVQIGVRLLVEARGIDIVLRPDEELVYEAIVREKRLPGGGVRLVTPKSSRGCA